MATLPVHSTEICLGKWCLISNHVGFFLLTPVGPTGCYAILAWMMGMEKDDIQEIERDRLHAKTLRCALDLEDKGQQYLANVVCFPIWRSS
jgi:hypothetical protein